MSEVLNPNLIDYSSRHLALFQEERARLLGALPPIDQNFVLDDAARSGLEQERAAFATKNALAYAEAEMGGADTTTSDATVSFQGFRIAVCALKNSVEPPTEVAAMQADETHRLSTRRVFGKPGFTHYQGLTRLLHETAETGFGDHTLVHGPAQEAPVRPRSRWRKCASWLGRKILRQSVKEQDESVQDVIRQKADQTFDAIWEEIGIPDTGEDEIEEQKLELRALFDTSVNDHVFALNSTNLRRDLVRLNEEKKYRSHTMAAAIAQSYALPRRQAARLVKDQVRLPAYSPLRLVSETVEIARLVQLADKKRALGTLALYSVASDAAIGLLPLMAADIVQSGASAGPVAIATGVSIAGYAARGMLYGKTHELAGDVFETLNNKIADAIFGGNPETLAEFDSSRLYNALREGKQAVEKTLNALIHTVMSSIIITGTATASLAAYSPAAAGISMVGIVPTYFLLKKVAARYYTQREESIRANNDSTKFLQDSTKAVNHLRTITQSEGAKADMGEALNRAERIERAARSRYARNFYMSKIPIAASTQLPVAVTGVLGQGTEAIASSIIAGPQIVWNVNRFLDYFLEAGDSGQRIEELRKVVESAAAEQTVVPEHHDIRLRDLRVILPKQHTRLKGNRRRLLDLSGSEVSVPEGTFAAFIGPSGSGKSTAVGALAGFLNFYGVAEIGGVPASRVKTNEVITYAPQAAHFNTKQTVLQNLLPGRTGQERLEQRAGLTQLMYDLGLDRFVDMYDEFMPERPSGGEAKRLNLARALSEDSPIVALDEPTSELDKISAGRVQVALAKYHRRNPNTTIIAITHDDDLTDVCDQVIDFGKLSNRRASRFNSR